VNFQFSSAQEAFYQEVDSFIRKELPAGWTQESHHWPGGYGRYRSLRSWLPPERSSDAGSGRKAGSQSRGPKEYGGSGRSHIEQAIFHERLSYYRAPGPGIATLIVGPTILSFGNEEQKKEWLPRIAKENSRFWLAYSEPGAGSDLASIQTRAVEDGDDLVINGQKTWSSAAHLSDYAWMLVRTDSIASPRKGISLVVVDNRSKGITVRP